MSAGRRFIGDFAGGSSLVLPHSVHQGPAIELLFQEEASGSLLLPSSSHNDFKQATSDSAGAPCSPG